MAFRSMSEGLNLDDDGTVEVTMPAGTTLGDTVWVFIHVLGESDDSNAYTFSGWTSKIPDRFNSKRLYVRQFSTDPATYIAPSYTVNIPAGPRAVYWRALCYDRWRRLNYQLAGQSEFHTGLTIGHFDGNYKTATEGGLWTNGPSTLNAGRYETRFPWLAGCITYKVNAASYPAYPTLTNNIPLWTSRGVYNGQIPPANNVFGQYMSVTFDSWDLLDHDEEGAPSHLFYTPEGLSTDGISRNDAWGWWGNDAGVEVDATGSDHWAWSEATSDSWGA